MLNLKSNFFLENVSAFNFIFLTSEDLEIVRNWRNNENIRKWFYTDHMISNDEHQKFIEKLKNDNHNYYWLVKQNNDYLGVVSLNKFDSKNKNSYLGIYANPDNPQKGIGSVLGNFLLHIAFNIANLHTLKLEVLENNLKAINFYKKLGFIEEGIIREIIYKSDKWVNVIIMGIINNE